MKTRVKTAFAALLLSALMAIEVFAATGKISFSDPSVKEGSEVNVTMKIAAEDGAVLSDANVTLNYDASKLEFVAGTDADGGAGTVRVHGASNGAGTGVLEYNLKFKTLGAGQSVITVNTQEVYDGASQPVELTHLGTSTITVNAGEEVSQNADLASLEIAPGSLTPAFSADVTSYGVSVDGSADSLTINAIPADSGANVVLSGNEGLAVGENTVTIRVTAADGQTVKDYTLLVTKSEEVSESPSGTAAESEGENESGEYVETENSGVQLSAKSKTITIMNPGSDVQIPEGFKSGTLSIDGQQVQGWVWGADSDPKYCVVYGMNDLGELNFYRYDLAEKTIQRYFEDPLAANSVSNQEYTALADEYNNMVEDYDMRFLIICILALVSLILFATVIYLFAKLRTTQREEQKQRRTPGRREPEAPHEDAYDEDLLKHDYEVTEPESAAAPIDETQVLKRPQSRRRGKNAVPTDTMPIPQAGRVRKEQGKDLAGADPAADADDAFDTFDI